MVSSEPESVMRLHASVMFSGDGGGSEKDICHITTFYADLDYTKYLYHNADQASNTSPVDGSQPTQPACID